MAMRRSCCCVRMSKCNLQFTALLCYIIYPAAQLIRCHFLVKQKTCDQSFHVLVPQGWSLAGTCQLKVRKPKCRCMDPTSGRLRYHHIHCMLPWKMSNHTYLLCTCTVLMHLLRGTTAVTYFSRHQTHPHPPSV